MAPRPYIQPPSAKKKLFYVIWPRFRGVVRKNGFTWKVIAESENDTNFCTMRSYSRKIVNWNLESDNFPGFVTWKVFWADFYFIFLNSYETKKT